MKTVLGVVLTTLACVVPASAQLMDGSRGSFPGCPSCGVLSYIDLPKLEATVARSAFTIHGWGFECVSGRPIRRVEVWYQDYDESWHLLKQPDGALRFNLKRPDVATAFREYCPKVSDDTGWVLTLYNAPPAGLRRMVINVWDQQQSPYRETHHRTYLVLDR